MSTWQHNQIDGRAEASAEVDASNGVRPILGRVSRKLAVPRPVFLVVEPCCGRPLLSGRASFPRRVHQDSLCLCRPKPELK